MGIQKVTKKMSAVVVASRSAASHYVKLNADVWCKDVHYLRNFTAHEHRTTLVFSFVQAICLHGGAQIYIPCI